MDTVIVFTAKNLADTFRQGGSGNWKLNSERVKKCSYAILTANKHHKKSIPSGYEHGSAFLIGKISGVTPDAYDDLGEREDGRWIIRFSEYAELNIPSFWKGFRNPVKYADISDLDVDLESLEWKPFPTEGINTPEYDRIPALTIDEAKRGIAKKLGIAPDNIEIIIRA
jgi:hypothetical protein